MANNSFNDWFKNVNSGGKPVILNASTAASSRSESAGAASAGIGGKIGDMWSSLTGKTSPATAAAPDVEAGSATPSYIPSFMSNLAGPAQPGEADWNCGLSR